MADGGWRMADGGWRMADGGLRMADGESLEPSATSHDKVLDLGDVAGLRALGTVNDLELHRLTFLERTETVALNSRVVDEDIAASVALDEAIPLRVVEPLDLACDTHRSSSLLAVTRESVGENSKGPKKKAAGVRPFPYGARPARRRKDNTGIPSICQER